MNSTIQNSLIDTITNTLCPSLISSIVGTVVGGLIAFYSGKRLVDRQQTHHAATTFAKAFIEELTRLRSMEDIDTYSILSHSLTKHQSAIQEFMFILPKHQQDKLQRLWHIYYCYNETEIPFLKQYADCGDLNKRKIMRQQAIDRIEAIYSFARKIKK